MGFDSVFYFRPCLNLFSGCLMLRAPVASSEKKTIFGRRASSVRTTCPAPAVWFHEECLNAWHVGSAQQFCVGDSIFPGDVNNLAKASEVKLIEFFGIAAKFHSHRAGTAFCTRHLVPKVMPCSPQTHVHNLLKEAPALASLFDTSLSDHSPFLGTESSFYRRSKINK